MEAIPIRIDIRTQSEMNLREHWGQRARRRKAHRLVASVATRDWKLGDGSSCAVTLTRIAPRALDSDNLSASFKGIRDGIADSLGVDDRSARITWAYFQRRGRPKEYAVEIAIATVGS